MPYYPRSRNRPVYDELRRLAARRMAREAPGLSLEATALVHEAYLRLVDGKVPQKTWRSRRHFYAAAAEAMRRILVDHARARKARKRGGGRARVELDEVAADGNAGSVEDLVALDEALAKLAQEDPAKADLVKLRYFAGLSLEQAAEALGISRATASRYWTYSKTWLYCRIRDSGEG